MYTKKRLANDFIENCFGCFEKTKKRGVKNVYKRE